jgi:hypothetical protein
MWEHVFVEIGSTNHKGAVAEAKIAAAAVELGVPVLKPLSEHGRYDLLFDVNRRFIRVQCKWAAVRGDVVVLRFESSRRGPDGFIRAPYIADEVDAVAAYCPDTEKCYFVPLSEVGPRRALQLRLAPPKNGQRASIHLAADYELGAVAQLGERCHGMAEVRGSSPLSSTSSTSPNGSTDVAPTSSAIASAGTWSAPPPARRSAFPSAAALTSAWSPRQRPPARPTGCARPPGRSRAPARRPRAPRAHRLRSPPACPRPRPASPRARRPG